MEQGKRIMNRRQATAQQITSSVDSRSASCPPYAGLSIRRVDNDLFVHRPFGSSGMHQ